MARPSVIRRDFLQFTWAAQIAGISVFLRLSAALFGVSIASATMHAADRPSLLARYSEDMLAQRLLSRSEWKPYPTVNDRAFWNALPDGVKRELIAQAETFREKPWPMLPATSFMEFYRSGSKEPYQSSSLGRRHRLGCLVLAECAEDRGRFLDDIVNGIWMICEESFWGNSPSTWVQAPIEEQQRFSGTQLQKIRTTLPDVTKPGVDLWVGETVGLLAMADCLLGARLDVMSPIIRQRIRHEAERRVLRPCLDRDFTWMFGRGNWNPWIGSNWLTAALLLEMDESRRRAAVLKVARSLDHYLGQVPADGASDEGPGYWRWSAGSLFDCLDLIHSATGGAISLYDEPLVRDLGRFIYRVHIADDYFFNFNDAPGRMKLPSELLVRFGRRIDDPHLVAMGASAEGGDATNLAGSLLRRVPALREISAPHRQPATAPLLRDAWLSDVQVMAARTQGATTRGFFVGAKAGHNGEGHNHNDVGDYVIFYDGFPVIIDIGPEAYTAENSSPRRYEIWTMQSAWHNLPTIGGVMQRSGKAFGARNVVYSADEAGAQLAMELAGAYPAEAGLTSWHRTVQLQRSGSVRVTERFVLSKPAPIVSLTLVTPCAVRQDVRGELSLVFPDEVGAVRVKFEATKLRAALERVELKDAGLRRSWGNELTRILLVADTPALQDTWSIKFESKPARVR